MEEGVNQENNKVNNDSIHARVSEKEKENLELQKKKNKEKQNKGGKTSQ